MTTTTSEHLTLHDLIHELTNAHQVAVHQHGRYIRTRTQAPLLDELTRARTAGLRRGGTPTAARERAELNIAATELDQAITRTIRRWALTTGYCPPRTGWPTTRAVLTRWYAHMRNAPDTAPHEAQLRTWHATIVELLVDPPRKWTLALPCPACGSRWADTGDERVDALSVQERDPIDATAITCRACGHRWDGLHGARALAAAVPA